MKSRLASVGIAMSVLPSCAGRGPSVEDVNDTVSMLERHSTWAWALAFGLIVADLVLPIPQTAVIAALGIIYGPALGGLIGATALIAAGGVAFGLMQTSARRVVVRIAGQRSMDKIGALSERTLPWGIALTRSLPYSVPKAVVCAAGLSGISDRPSSPPSPSEARQSRSASQRWVPAGPTAQRSPLARATCSPSSCCH